MGERDRYYYERNAGRHEDRDESPYRQQAGQRGSRDWQHNEDYRRNQRQDERDYNAGPRTQDERDFGSHHESHRNEWERARRFEPDRSNDPGYGYDYARNERERHAQSGYGQSGNYGQGSYGQGSYGQGQGQGNYGQGNYGQSGYGQSQSQGNYGQGNYGERRPFGFDRSYGREYLGGGAGQGLYEGADWSRTSPQQRYAQHDYNPPRYGWGHEGGYQGQRDRDDESWGQQLRDVGNQVARKVKRVFRGPKGYKRSDERIREDVSDRLAQQDQIDPSEVEVAVSNGEVTLTGTVQSRHEKFLVEEIADDVGGVSDVHNQLRVQRSQQATSSGAGVLSGTGTEGSASNQNANEATRGRNARA